MDCLEDGQPHTMAEIKIYVREKLAESGFVIPGRYGDPIDLAITPLLSKPGCPYRRIQNGVYQKGTPQPLSADTPMDPVHEFLNRCFELDEYAQQFFSKEMSYKGMREVDRQCCLKARERVPQLLDEMLAHAAAITAIVEEVELGELQQMPRKNVRKRGNSHER